MPKNRLYRRNVDGGLVLSMWNSRREGWEYYIRSTTVSLWWRAGNQSWQKCQCKRNAKLIGVNVEFR